MYRRAILGRYRTLCGRYNAAAMLKYASIIISVTMHPSIHVSIHHARAAMPVRARLVDHDFNAAAMTNLRTIVEKTGDADCT